MTKFIIKGLNKVKQYRNPSEVVKILNFLKSKDFNVPKVISHDGTSITMEYIEGDSLDKIELSDELIEKAAKLLAGMHKLDFKELGLKPKTKLLESFDEKVDLLNLEEGELLKQEYKKLWPKNIEFCLGHFDYQPSNLILNKGELWIIDFEGLCVGPKGVDMAKAKYHFGEEFLIIYMQYGDASHYLKNKRFYDLREHISQEINKLKNI